MSIFNRVLIVEIFYEPICRNIDPISAVQTFEICDPRNFINWKFWENIKLFQDRVDNFFDCNKGSFKKKDFKEIWRAYVWGAE